jgi:DNA uptake protein ComE-like DNA-binding protein
MFLAGVALLGAGTRVWRSRRPPANSSTLDEQIAAVDSSRGRPQRKQVRRGANPPTRQPVDLDVASAGDIEKLPGIGPSLARRIAADRDEKGPFRCLAAVDRVKGIGPALLTKLDSLVTFSAADANPCGTPARPPAGRPPR